MKSANSPESGELLFAFCLSFENCNLQAKECVPFGCKFQADQFDQSIAVNGFWSIRCRADSVLCRSSGRKILGKVGWLTG
ncbi:hypothetical protein T10_3830 [Trichinella papuae]|uniref:Uncharacterized protein n=1 Tax=Trichinella papuae TaxID=268474 RepID=A0A0V1ME59_9BILA|nr:hypothetical protein T10_3830 [Trichinella papuae]